jgi:two-component system NtrC family sensor kinase
VPRRLAQRLILSLTVIVVIIAAVSGLITVRNQERQLLDAMILGADQLSQGIASATWHAMLANHRESAYSVMQTIASKRGIDAIRIYNRDGLVMFSTTKSEAGRVRAAKTSEACAVCHSRPTPVLVSDAARRSRIARTPAGHRTLSIVTPILNGRSCSQAACHAHPANQRVLGVLDVGLSLNDVDAEVADMKFRASLVSAIEIILIGAFIFAFTRRFVATPVRKLAEAAKSIAAMELDRPIPLQHGTVELDQLAESFNKMRAKLHAAMEVNAQFTENLEAKVAERTEQLKAAQQKLMQSDRLASLGQLAASVAHEINNPVSGVLNLAMLMQRVLNDDGIPPGRIPEFRRYLEQVISETTRVGRIVSDLLSFSRRSKPQRTPADLNRIVRSTMSLVAHKLRLANVEVVLDLDESLPPLACDSSQMQQVVVNLVLNGAEATQAKGGGRISVKTAMSPDKNSVVLTVSDTGEGIQPENLSKIFDPFFTTKPEGKGVGLGLAVLYGIVEAHGGEIEVKSRVGEGTTFIITMPLNAADQPKAVALPIGSVAAHNREMRLP